MNTVRKFLMVLVVACLILLRRDFRLYLTLQQQPNMNNNNNEYSTLLLPSLATEATFIQEDASTLGKQNHSSSFALFSNNDHHSSSQEHVTAKLNETATTMRPPAKDISSLTNTAKTATNTTTTASSNKPKVLAMGCIRDAAEFMKDLAQTMVPQLQRELNIQGVVLFENDSSDTTVEILQQEWNVTLLQQPGMIHLLQGPTNYSQYFTSREDLLAHARIQLWDYAYDLYDKKQLDFDYILMVDWDDVNLHLAHAETCLELPTDEASLEASQPPWLVCCANSYTVWYDLFSLRTFDSWVPGDFWSDKDVIKGEYNFRHLDAITHAPLQVKSCFNGAAMYRWKILYERLKEKERNTKNRTEARFWYSYTGRSNNKRGIVCEHVPFHLRLLEEFSSYGIYIQPKMLNEGPAWTRRKKFYWKRVSNETRYAWRNIPRNHSLYATMDWSLYPSGFFAS